jgi:GNAT superfamily N-acetyltransferase
MTELIIRPAKPTDIEQIFAFITELAIYEKAEHEVVTTPRQLHEKLFCASPKVFALMCEANGQAIGFAVYFFNFSTWLGQHGIYLEDLYVSAQHRGLGAGKALLKKLAEIAVAEDCGRVEWSVLDWNQPAIDFYQSLDAFPQDEWTIFRLTGDALTDFAKAKS